MLLAAQHTELTGQMAISICMHREKLHPPRFLLSPVAPCVLNEATDVTSRKRRLRPAVMAKSVLQL